MYLSLKRAFQSAGIAIALIAFAATASADRNKADLRSSSPVAVISAEEISHVGIDLGAIIPQGDFGEVAKTGPTFGIRGRIGVTSRVAVGVDGIWVKPSEKDVPSFLDESILGFQALSRIEIFPTAAGSSLYGNSLRGPSIVGRAGVINVVTKSDNNGFKQNFTNTDFMGSIGAQWTLPVGGAGELSAYGHYNHIFAENSENWIQAGVSYSTQLGGSWYNRGERPGRILYDYSKFNIGPSVQCHFPYSDMALESSNGLGFGLRSTYQVKPKYRIFVDGQYQLYTPLWETPDVTWDISNIAIKAGVQRDVNFVPDIIADPYIGVSLTTNLWKQKQENANQPDPIDISETVFTVNAEAGFRWPLSNSISFDVSMGIPLAALNEIKEEPQAGFTPSYDYKLTKAEVGLHFLYTPNLSSR